jgi:hypothetical protein
LMKKKEEEEEKEKKKKKMKFFSSVCSDSVHSAVEDFCSTHK